jgi:hypothetical protein
MRMSEDVLPILLFSYGTLQLDSVQLASFGRLLEGEADALPGWRRDWLEITDPAVLAASGERFHPVVSRSDDAADIVEGTVFRISADELAAADRYEVSDYVRVLVPLRSGRQAWVYVRA